MRVLVASTVGSGHFRPLIPWIEALSAAGHDVVVAGSTGLAEMASRWRFHDCGAPDPDHVAGLWAKLFDPALKDPQAHVVGNIFTRANAGALLPAMTDLIDDFQPDLVLREPMEFAAGVVAARAGVRQMRIAISLARFDRLMIGYAGPVVEEWEPGVSEVLTASPYLTRFPASLDPEADAEVTRYRLAHPPPRDVEPGFVYATLGTVAPAAGHLVGWFDVISAALGGLELDTLLTVGKQVDPASVRPAPGILF